MAEHVRYELPPLDVDVLRRLTDLASESENPEFLNLVSVAVRLAQRSQKMEHLLAIVFEIVGPQVTVDMLERHGLLGDEPDPPRR